jgi:hypothetical protein
MRSCTALLLTLVLPTSLAHAASIGLFADPECATCNITIPIGETATIYAMLDATELPPGVTGVTGAVFRIAGLPPGWTAVSTPNPLALVAMGDPTGPVGAAIGFEFPQVGACVLLYSIGIAATTTSNDILLYVTHRDPPPHPLSVCPAIVPDCTPSPCPFAPHPCVSGGALRINSGIPCTVAVDRATWTTIRRLYR